MKRTAVVVALLLFMVPRADACVGKLLSIGVVNSSEGKLLSEILSVMITERTGTAVTVKHFQSPRELYEAVKTKQVDIWVDNTAHAMRVLNKAAETDAKKAYEFVKAAYEKELGLVWLRPFGFQNSGGGPSHTAAILRAEILNNFPVLPRVINKLGGSINDEAYARLIASVESGEKPKKVARDFLKSKKLI